MHCRNTEGLFPRVFGGVARALGVKQKHVMIGFIICAVVNFPLALLLFGLSWVYVDHPGTWQKAADKTAKHWRRHKDRHERGHARTCRWREEKRARRTAETQPQPAAGPVDPEAGDPFFADLRSRFADLEKRAGKMEGYVTSQEFRLNREFRDLKG